ncbi:MAG: hypothetical protein CVU89_17655 [Firmicutes bacterium HGW-Firmicutes-14]|jgi:hypothetical protein|nr:MAG: hypothetical protein CVU89_17655 [Firmicutes bacterium HGW-Firmicutes-14]
MVKKLFLICTLFLAITGCQYNTATEINQGSTIINLNPGNKAKDDKLMKTINEYYNFEKNELWDKAYEYRDLSFRQSVPKDFYVKQMSKDNDGWHLVKFEIIDVSIEHNRAIAKIMFTELSPREINFNGETIKEHYAICKEDTKWIKQGDKWFSIVLQTILFDGQLINDRGGGHCLPNNVVSRFGISASGGSHFFKVPERPPFMAVG